MNTRRDNNDKSKCKLYLKQFLVKTGKVRFPENSNNQGQDKSVIQKQAMVRAGSKTSTKTQSNSLRSKSKGAVQSNENKQGNGNKAMTMTMKQDYGKQGNHSVESITAKKYFVKACLAWPSL